LPRKRKQKNEAGAGGETRKRGESLRPLPGPDVRKRKSIPNIVGGEKRGREKSTFFEGRPSN